MDTLEYAKLGVAALTPIITGLIGFMLVRMGHRIENERRHNLELLRKRLELFEVFAPALNDIYCYYQAVGHWSDLDPEKIIQRKRTVDRALNVNRYLFRPTLWDAYRQFELAHFEMYAGVGLPARLRLDVPHMRTRIGELFKAEWMPCVSQKAGDHEEQSRSYHRLMDALGSDVKGSR
jgi:hypothetical protein